METIEGGKTHGHFFLDKIESEKADEIARFLQAGGSLDDASRIFGMRAERFDLGENVECNAGINVLEQLFIGAASQTNFSATNARLTVGTSSTAAAATDTALGAFGFGQGVDSGYPTASAQVMTIRITVAVGNGNISWQEFGLDNYAATGGTAYTTTAPTYSSTLVLFDHVVSNQGTKTSGQIWVLTLTVTQS